MLIRVYYEDTDAGGIVFHPNYIKFCERARSELFFQKDMIPLNEKNAGFVIRHIDANFLGMAKLGDLLQVHTSVIKKKSASIIMQQIITKDEKEIFKMDITLVFVVNGKPKIIPDMFAKIFAKILS